MNEVSNQPAADSIEDSAPPSFGDALHFLWNRRVRLARTFAAILFLGLIGMVIWMLRERVAEATLALSFKGIEKGEYPNQRKFSVADVAGLQVLRRAIREMGKEKVFPEVETLARGIEVVPVIPGEIQTRWKGQDKSGAKREEYFPSSFRMTARPKGMSAEESVQFLYAVLKAYQSQVKDEQLGALKFLGDVARYKPEELIRVYDYWDLPRILEENVMTLAGHLRTLTDEAKDFRDPKFNMSFQDLDQDLSVWSLTRLEALRGLVDGDRLVKNRDTMMKRLQARQEQVDIQVRGVTQELTEATKLLETVDRPRTTLAGPLSGKDGLPIIDTNALDRLVASDYLGGVVKRVTSLQERKARLQEKRWGAERDLTLLSKAQDVPLEKLPPAFQRDLSVVVSDLSRIIDGYHTLLRSYLDATVTSQVVLRDGPRVVRPGPPALFVLVGIIFGSAVLALLWLFIGTTFESAVRRPA